MDIYTTRKKCNGHWKTRQIYGFKLYEQYDLTLDIVYCYCFDFNKYTVVAFEVLPMITFRPIDSNYLL